VALRAAGRGSRGQRRKNLLGGEAGSSFTRNLNAEGKLKRKQHWHRVGEGGERARCG
jgi:hypothetical protein